MAVLGTTLSRRMLDGMTDAQFRTWSQRLVVLTGTFSVKGCSYYGSAESTGVCRFLTTAS
jgi:hypothetical protein